MARQPYSGDDEDIDHQPPLFKVFDPLHQWKELPLSPYCENIYPFNEYYSWGHYFVLSSWRGVHLFDTHQEKWEHWPQEHNDRPVVFRAVVEFEGFLIGVICSNPYWDNELAVYQLDPNGIPKLIRVLHELQGIFCPFLRVYDCFIGKCDGGRLWLVYSGKHAKVRVAVFQVFISDDLAGDPVISTELEAAEFYCLPTNSYQWDYRMCYSAFSMHHNTKNRDTEEKNLCGKIIPHDHP